MPGRQKFHLYAVSNGRDIGIYMSWPQAGGSTLGYANAKYKGYITYIEAKAAMESSGIEDFNVYDGQNTFTKAEYEGNREKIMSNTEKKSVRQCNC